MKPLILWLIAICTLTLAVATCGDSDDDDESDADNVDDDMEDDDANDDDAGDDEDDDTGDDDTQAECNTWTDTASGLTWNVDAAESIIGWSSATAHCASLVCDGHDDWRLPTITELRSLVRGCQNTEFGGSCRVTDDCLGGDECYDGGCEGCGVGNGPADGCYWPNEMSESCVSLWSSSNAQTDELHWYITFDQAGLATGSEGFSHPTVRCARGEFSPAEDK